jgi:amidase
MDTRGTRSVGAVTRRGVLRAGAAGAALLLAGRANLLEAQVVEDPPYLGATILQLQALMASGLTSRELTQAYLERIAQLNPLLGAVIETNPAAVSIAARLDRERRARRVRGPLHGIPVLVKDNIATDDQMQTTAGSLALVNSRVPADALIVARLRAAGAVILGKANLSEWANFRGLRPHGVLNGWSARGGFTRNPYVLDYDPAGSSSGSCVGAAANLCAAAVGTETAGSIVGPSGNNHVVGLKTSLGLVSQDGIIPFAHSQDGAGPVARTVHDVAILLGALRSPFGDAAKHVPSPPTDYTRFLRRVPCEAPGSAWTAAISHRFSPATRTSSPWWRARST